MLTKFEEDLYKFLTIIKERNRRSVSSTYRDYSVMSWASFEMYYFVLDDGALTSKMSKMALDLFCDENEELQTLSEGKKTSETHYPAFRAFRHVDIFSR